VYVPLWYFADPTRCPGCRTLVPKLCEGETEYVCQWCGSYRRETGDELLPEALRVPLWREIVAPAGGVGHSQATGRPSRQSAEGPLADHSLGGTASEEPQANKRSEVPSPRIRCDRLTQTVTLDGSPVSLDMTAASRDAAICYLSHLLTARGDWRSASELDAMERKGPCKNHVEVRWDRVRKKLPPCLLALTETHHSKGHRLVAAVWHK
jgi:hypothetical protein